MNRRRLTIVAALAVWMQACASYAQSKIEVPAKVELGEPIVATVTLPAGGKVAWKAGAGVSLIDAGEGRAYLWAKPGQAKIEAVLVSVTDGQLGTLEWLEATFEVEGAVPPTPVPPTPVPPTPVPPTPSGKRQVVIIYETVDKTPALARLLTDTQAGVVAKYLKDRGHPSAKVLDDDILPDALKSKLGNLPPLPAMIVMDAATGAVTLADQLPATSAAVTELIKRAGG